MLLFFFLLRRYKSVHVRINNVIKETAIQIFEIPIITNATWSTFDQGHANLHLPTSYMYSTVDHLMRRKQGFLNNVYEVVCTSSPTYAWLRLAAVMRGHGIEVTDICYKWSVFEMALYCWCLASLLHIPPWPV